MILFQDILRQSNILKFTSCLYTCLKSQQPHMHDEEVNFSNRTPLKCLHTDAYFAWFIWDLKLNLKFK